MSHLFARPRAEKYYPLEGFPKFTNVGTEFVLAQCTINGVEKTGDDCGMQTNQVNGGFNYAKLKVDCED